MAKDKGFIVEPTGPTKISNPAVNYGTSAGTCKWQGDALSFERRVRFGRELPCPWFKTFEVTAPDALAAAALLARLAAREGYALGGIQNLRRKEG